MSDIIQLTYSDRNGFHRFTVVRPESTDVKAVAVAGQTLIQSHASHAGIAREVEAAREASSRFAAKAQQDALEAGRIGAKPDKGGTKKRRQAVADRLDDAELDFTASGSNLASVRAAYLGVLAHHSPVLEHEAKAAADSAVLGLVTAVQIASRAQSALTSSLGMLAGLPGVVLGGVFEPAVRMPRRRPGDDGTGTVPTIFAEEAVGNLKLAIAWTQRVLEDLADDKKQARNEVATLITGDDVGADDDDEIVDEKGAAETDVEKVEDE